MESEFLYLKHYFNPTIYEIKIFKPLDQVQLGNLALKTWV